MMDETAYPGVLVLVVGPSGAGKDSLLRRARADLSSDERFIFVRRAVTRPSDPANEEVDTLSDRDFAVREVAGEFALSWQVHGLSYGLPRSVIQPALTKGRCVIANTSRGIIAHARLAYPNVAVILVTADPQTLAQRLAARGRESAATIAQRLARALALTTDAADATIRNDGAIEDSAQRFCAILRTLAAKSQTAPLEPATTS